MAYYEDEYIWSQQQTNHRLIAHEDPVSFLSYGNYNAYNVSEFHEPKFLGFDHGSNEYCCDYDYNYDYEYDYGHNSYVCADSEINYFGHTFMEPKLVMYEPVECNTCYVSYHTHYSISNSRINDSGFNEPEFEEYDPTPYGGGYDIVAVYGKPLPPSDKTCYPRSKPSPIQPKTEPGPELQPMIEKLKLEPEKESNPPEKVHVPVVMPMPESFHTPLPVFQPEPEQSEVRDINEREKAEYGYPGYGCDYPWPEYDNGNVVGVGYDYGYGKPVVQIPPYEYDPEVVDLCENLFGSWPCLARIRNQQQMCTINNQGITNPEKTHNNPWEVCARYIFGGPNASLGT